MYRLARNGCRSRQAPLLRKETARVHSTVRSLGGLTIDVGCETDWHERRARRRYYFVDTPPLLSNTSFVCVPAIPISDNLSPSMRSVLVEYLFSAFSTLTGASATVFPLLIVAMSPFTSTRYSPGCSFVPLMVTASKNFTL